MCDAHAPLKSKRLRPSKSSWITTGFKKRMNYRDHLKKKAVKSNSLIDWNHYRTLKNQINKEIKIAKQNYYINAFDNPYISYGLASWGAACQTRLQTVRTKQNKCIRSIFFASQRENASIYYKLLELHNLDNIFNIKIASLVYKLKYLPSNTPAALHKLITPSSGVHNYNTRYASKENLYRPVSRTNYGLSRFSSMASRVWEKVPYRLKILPFSSFIQQYKHHLLVNQN